MFRIPRQDRAHGETRNPLVVVRRIVVLLETVPQKVGIQRAVQVDVEFHFGAASDKLLRFNRVAALPSPSAVFVQVAHQTFGGMVGTRGKRRSWALLLLLLLLLASLQLGEDHGDQAKGCQAYYY